MCAARKTSVNLDNGPILLNPALQSSAPTKRLFYCPSCGAVSFLEGPCRGCGAEQRKLLKDVVNGRIRALRRRLLLSQLGMTLLLLLLTAVYAFGAGEALRCFEEPAVPLAAAAVVGLFLLYVWILQISVLFSVVRMNRCSRGPNINFGCAMAHSGPAAAQSKPPRVEQTWLAAVTCGYRQDVLHLARAYEALTGEKKAGERGGGIYENGNAVYTAALELSHICDCRTLALLRLKCLHSMAMLTATSTDIQQILHILPVSTLRGLAQPYWETIIQCLESSCTLIDAKSARKLALVCCNWDALDRSGALRELMLRGIVACGPVNAVDVFEHIYWDQADRNEDHHLAACLLEVQNKYPLFRELMETYRKEKAA